MTNVIEVQNISKTFNGLPILFNINFQVQKGNCLVVLGQSGIGKSVLLKILAGLIEPDSGSIKLQTNNLGMLFQKNALFDSLTVYENLDFTLKERTDLKKPIRHQKILQFLKWVELENTDQLFPDELSGGMQKRLGIARALIVEPEIILYDEPTAGLDPITSRIIADLISKLRRELKTTVVAVTSDVHRAYQLADQIGLLKPSQSGAVFFNIGTPEQTRTSSQTDVQQFLQGKTHGPLTTGGVF